MGKVRVSLNNVKINLKDQIRCCLFDGGVSPSVSSSDVNLTAIEEELIEVPQQDVSEDLDIDEEPQQVYYALTINIQPTKKINGRQWKLYDADQQRKILTRIEKSLRTKNPSIELCEMHFEECPILKQQHFHGLYKMPDMFVSVLLTYYERVVGSTGNQKIPWRHCVIDKVYDRPGWLEYIRKNLN